MELGPWLSPYRKDLFLSFISDMKSTHEYRLWWAFRYIVTKHFVRINKLLNIGS